MISSRGRAGSTPGARFDGPQRRGHRPRAELSSAAAAHVACGRRRHSFSRRFHDRFELAIRPRLERAPACVSLTRAISTLVAHVPQHILRVLSMRKAALSLF